MRDAITDVFLTIDEGPDDEFVAVLRSQLLAELDRTDSSHGTDTPQGENVLDVVGTAVLDAPLHRPGRRRRRAIALAAVGIAAAAIIVPVLRTDTRQRIDNIDESSTTTTTLGSTTTTAESVTSTTMAGVTEPGLSRHLAGDVITGDGRRLHVEADIAVPPPISVATDDPDEVDLQFTPVVSITVTEPDNPTGTVIDAIARINFVSDFTGCVRYVGSSACRQQLFSARTSSAAATAVGDGLSFPVNDALAQVGTVRVATNSLEAILSQFGAGDLFESVRITIDVEPSSQRGLDDPAVAFDLRGEP